MSSDTLIEVTKVALTPKEEMSLGRFKVKLSWSKVRKETNKYGDVATWTDGAGIGTGYTWYLAGDREYSEELDKEGRPLWEWHPQEKLTPLKLKTVETGIESLAYYRIPCATTGSKEKALVIFMADDIDTISKHVLVSGRRHSFRWDNSSFRSYGKPVRQPGTESDGK